VMRGISSMAKAETPAVASPCRAASLPYGSMMATTTAPGFAPESSPSPGRRTLRITSAARSASSRLAATVAPAASNSASGMPAPAPAPACTTTSAPRPLYLRTVSGVAATRVSTGSVSDRTAIRISFPHFERRGCLAPRLSAPVRHRLEEYEHEQQDGERRGARLPLERWREEPDRGGD